MKIQLLLLWSIALVPASAPTAVASSHTKAETGTAAQASTSAPLAQGEVKKVDKDGAKITIQHGPIANLDMPGMTMVFRVRDPAMLNAVKAGDKVRFAAEKSGGAITVTRLEPAK